MAKKSFFLFFFTCVFISACDPALRLLVQSNPKGNCSVTVYANKKAFSVNEKNSTEKMIVKVPFTDSITKYEKLYIYGIGVWSDSLVNELASNIDSIIIKTDQTLIQLDNTEDVEDYLLRNRSGFANSIITIKPE